jgi:hypothetical protein
MERSAALLNRKCSWWKTKAFVKMLNSDWYSQETDATPMIVFATTFYPWVRIVTFLSPSHRAWDPLQLSNLLVEVVEAIITCTA